MAHSPPAALRMSGEGDVRPHPPKAGHEKPAVEKQVHWIWGWPKCHWPSHSSGELVAKQQREIGRTVKGRIQEEDQDRTEMEYRNKYGGKVKSAPSFSY